MTTGEDARVLISLDSGVRHRWNPETRLALCGLNPVGWFTRHEHEITCKRCLRKEK